MRRSCAVPRPNESEHRLDHEEESGKTYVRAFSEPSHELLISCILEYAVAKNMIHHVRIKLFMVQGVLRTKFREEWVLRAVKGVEEGGDVRGCWDVEDYDCLYNVQSS